MEDVDGDRDYREEIVVDNGAVSLGLNRVHQPRGDGVLDVATSRRIGAVAPGDELRLVFETIYGNTGEIVIRVPDVDDHEARKDADL